MKHVFTFFLVALMLGNSIMAQENFRQQDRWLALIDFAQVKPEAIKNAAPHFPGTDVSNEKSYKEFSEKLAQWKKKYANETEALLAIPEIKKLNPSRVHLGLQQAIEVRKFENSYWQWMNVSGLAENEIEAIAQHLPKPDLKAHDILLAEKNYESAVSDWMLLFPKEAGQLFNHPAMKAHAVAKEPVEITAPATDDAYLYVKVSAAKPERNLFGSGNETLDNLRYETYLKAWYHRYCEEDFYRIYYPEQLAEWKKNRDGQKEIPQY